MGVVKLEKKNKVKVIMLLLVIGVITSAFFLFKSTEYNKSNEFIYYGNVEADKINVSAEVSGKVSELKVKEGSKVKTGELIATIGSNESSLKLQNAEISIKNAENELGKIQDGNRAEEIKSQQALVRQAQALVEQGESALKVAQNNVSAAKTNSDYKKKKYEDASTLYKNGAEAKSTVDAAKNELDNAQSTLDNAMGSLDSTQAQLNNYKAQLDASSEKLNLLVNGATERDKNSAEYNLDKAKKDYELSKIALDKSKIVTAKDGVIETVNFKEGEYVTPGSPIATLLDNQNMWVKVYVPESILPSIKLNKEVILKSEFLKDKTIKGKVIYISPEAEFTPMNIVTKKDRMKLVYEVKIRILDNLESVKPGMLMDVNLK